MPSSIVMVLTFSVTVSRSLFCVSLILWVVIGLFRLDLLTFTDVPIRTQWNSALGILQESWSVELFIAALAFSKLRILNSIIRFSVVRMSTQNCAISCYFAYLNPRGKPSIFEQRCGPNKGMARVGMQLEIGHYGETNQQRRFSTAKTRSQRLILPCRAHVRTPNQRWTLGAKQTETREAGCERWIGRMNAWALNLKDR